MNKYSIRAPVTVLYRANLRDTASLVGLVNAGIPIGVIAFIGPLELEAIDYVNTLNSWLEGKGYPKLSIHPALSAQQISKLIDRPYRVWGWDDTTCKTAINLAGLPLPPGNPENTVSEVIEEGK